MIKNIFKKDEKGNYIIDYDNLDLEYYRHVLADDRNTLENLSFIWCGLDFEHETTEQTFLENLRTKRMIDSKSLRRDISNRKSRLNDIIKEILQQHSPSFKLEDKTESYMLALSELEKFVEHKAVADLIGKEEITDEDKKLVEKKRKDIESMLSICENADLFFNQREDLIRFIELNKDFDSKITEKKASGKKYSFDLNYDYLKSGISVQDLSKIRLAFSKYRKKYGVDIEKACDEILAISRLDSIKEDIDKEREIFRLISEKEIEYKTDLENKEKLVQDEEARKKAEEERKLEEKRKREEEERKRKEEEHKKNKKESVKPLIITFMNSNGKRIIEQFPKQYLNELFDIIKKYDSSCDEKIVFIILTDGSKEEALKALMDLREEARANGANENRIEGVLSEWGKEFITDENTIIPLIDDEMVRKDLESLAKDNKKKFPMLKRKDNKKSFLTYSLEEYKDNPEEIEKIIADHKNKKKRTITLVKDRNNTVMYGVPNINFIMMGKILLDGYFNKKYYAKGNAIEIFSAWKKRNKEKEEADKKVEDEQK